MVRRPRTVPFGSRASDATAPFPRAQEDQRAVQLKLSLSQLETLLGKLDAIQGQMDRLQAS